MLDDYYRGAGSQDPVQIELPVGSYRPRFERRAVAEPVAALAAPAPTSQFGFPAAALSRRVVAAAYFSIIGVALCAWLAGASLARLTKVDANSGPFVNPPVVVVESANGAEATVDARNVTEIAVTAIESELSALDHFVVARRAKAAGARQADYVLSVRAEPTRGGAGDFVFQLVYEPTSEIVWSGAFPAINFGDATAIANVIDIVVATAGDIYVGAVMADQRRRMAISNAPLEGFACVIEGDEYLFSASPRSHLSARDCAERESSLNPQDSRARALLSGILYRDYADMQPSSKGSADVERLGALALRSFEIAPHRTETSTACSLANSRRGASRTRFRWRADFCGRLRTRACFLPSSAARLSLAAVTRRAWLYYLLSMTGVWGCRDSRSRSWRSPRICAATYWRVNRSLAEPRARAIRWV